MKDQRVNCGQTPVGKGRKGGTGATCSAELLRAPATQGEAEEVQGLLSAVPMFSEQTASSQPRGKCIGDGCKGSYSYL